MNARIYAAATLVAALFVALPASAADSRLLNLVMPDANVVAGVNVNRAKATPFGQYVVAQLTAQNQELQKMVSLLGFDPRNDVSELLVASHAEPRTAAGQSARQPVGLVLAIGNFDAAKISSAVALGGGKTETYAGATLFEDPSQKSALTILDGSIAVLGDVANVKGAIDRRGGAGSSALPSDLYGLVNRWSSLQDAWAVANVPPGLLKAPGAAASQIPGLNQPTMWQTVQSAAGGINFAAGANVVATIEAYSDTAQNAASMAGALQLLANMAKLQTSKDPQAANLLNALSVVSDANVVKMTLSLPADQFQKLVSPKPKSVVTVRPGRPTAK